MSSHISNSNNFQDNFSLLAEPVQRWIWEQGWTELRDIQKEAIQPILSGNTDLLISASTASGKTEAAFLPICSSLLGKQFPGVRALYVSPLKALINDQYERLCALCEHLHIPVFKWHGDVSSSAKRRFLQNAEGILLITPESLEALFVLHGPAISDLFSQLDYCVIDELHTFIGTERGRQLQTLLHRIETVEQRRIARIGLSATLGDMALAEEFLRSNSTFPCQYIKEKTGGQDISLQVRGHLSSAELNDEIVKHLFSTLRGSSNLIFANRRSETELYCAALRSLCEEHLLPVEFWPHHGSLSKVLREETEHALKDRSTPTTAVCTTTLEMGIDVGSVKSIAQLGIPPSVASLKQRLGRSGRRGEPAILRVYIQEPELDAKSYPPTLLRSSLFQTVATINLLLKGWCEAPLAGTFHFSTLIQQILSMICQYGAIDALKTWRVLCERGPFSNVSSSLFATLLRAMGAHHLLTQTHDGTLVLDWRGEKLVNNYDFYSAFSSLKEYTLLAGGKPLGTMPVIFPPTVDMFMVFAGRYWQITDVDAERKIITLIPATSGKPYFSGGEGFLVSDRIREEMLRLYVEEDIPRYLNGSATNLFQEGLKYFKELRLFDRRMLPWGNELILFPWKGDRVVETLQLVLQHRNIHVQGGGFSLVCSKIQEEELKRELVEILNSAIDPITLLANISDKHAEKHDCFLNEELLNLEFAAKNIDLPGVYNLIQELVK